MNLKWSTNWRSFIDLLSKLDSFKCIIKTIKYIDRQNFYDFKLYVLRLKPKLWGIFLSDYYHRYLTIRYWLYWFDILNSLLIKMPLLFSLNMHLNFSVCLNMENMSPNVKCYILAQILTYFLFKVFSCGLPKITAAVLDMWNDKGLILVSPIKICML